MTEPFERTENKWESKARLLDAYGFKDSAPDALWTHVGDAASTSMLRTTTKHCLEVSNGHCGHAHLI